MSNSNNTPGQVAGKAVGVVVDGAVDLGKTLFSWGKAKVEGVKQARLDAKVKKTAAEQAKIREIVAGLPLTQAQKDEVIREMIGVVEEQIVPEIRKEIAEELHTKIQATKAKTSMRKA